jgi:hypothetical protein
MGAAGKIQWRLVMPTIGLIVALWARTVVWELLEPETVK